MSLSPSASPSPADSPPATSSPPAPPLSPLPSPLGSPPPLAPPPTTLPPTASPPPPSPPLEAPPVPPEEPPPSPPQEPPPSPPSPSGSPPLPFLPAKPSPPPSESPPPPVKTVTPPPPSLPIVTTPPVNTASPPPPSPPRRRGPKPSLPPPEPSPTTPSLPETSPPLSTTPFPSSSTPAPKNSPAETTLPFFGPVGPPDGTVATPNGPIIEPKTTPGETISRTTSYHRSSAGFLFGGVIVGALLLVLLGLLFVFYRATRNRNNTSRHHQSKTPPKVQHQRGGNVEPDQTNVITIPPPNYSSSVSYGTKESNAAAMNVTVSSGTFAYEELLEATGGFSEANLLGEGGFGYVHKGVLRNGREVAVKQLKIGSNQGEREFQAEVDTISRVHHKHLVSLVGYCINGDKRLLVYEFVPKDTLEFHLHGNRGSVLEWGMRLRIAVGAAKGLAYLHEDCDPTIIHRDIKAANILLDSKYEAKVSDFGLAKFFSDTNSSVTHISTRVVGTFGYMAPEYASSGKVTDKSDVYSFGVVLLELITGRPPIFARDPTRNLSLVDWARPLLAKTISGESFDPLVDPRLEKNYDTTQMADMAACAASCIRQSAWLRPRMSQVIRALEGEVTLRNVEERYSSSENPVTYGTSKRRFNTDSSDGSTSEYGINPSQSSSEQHQFTGSRV
ncbi:hypothetical protein Bca52824_089533 [Brassica carinata]|uniref:non-specific serine/threonine protein kinase n=1 Tax=Brassica carinata TaxID=52824 RepID=A0A8X7PER0_BRACI|nr:hypothetical protein Bca52824_089533 [Brassica carinata]